MADKASQDWDSSSKTPSNLEIAEYLKSVPDKSLANEKDGRAKIKAEPVARALLSLGNEIHLRPSTTPHGPDENGTPNSASFFGVEEAVMRYVGGTLQDDRAHKKRKTTSNTSNPTAGQYEADFNEYIGNGSWEKFLREDITGTGEPDGHDAHPEAYSTIFDSATTAHDPSHGPGPNPAPARSSVDVPNELQHKKRKSRDRSMDTPLTHINGADVPPHSLVDQSLFQASPPGLGGLAGGHHSSDEKAKLDLKNRIAWTGDGSETGGSFDDAECRLLNEFLERFMMQNSLTRQQLCERVWTAERKKDNFWDAVSAVLPHRTRASVYKHVRRVYHVFTVRGKWSPSEDLQLGQLVNERGAQWKSISLTMHRMPEDCRDRWRNYVKCGGHRNQNKWSVKEETQLQRVVTQQMAQNPGAPVNWTIVSEQMGCTRSRIQCRYKWKKLVRKAPPPS